MDWEVESALKAFSDKHGGASTPRKGPRDQDLALGADVITWPEAASENLLVAFDDCKKRPDLLLRLLGNVIEKRGAFHKMPFLVKRAWAELNSKVPVHLPEGEPAIVLSCNDMLPAWKSVDGGYQVVEKGPEKADLAQFAKGALLFARQLSSPYNTARINPTDETRRVGAEIALFIGKKAERLDMPSVWGLAMLAALKSKPSAVYRMVAYAATSPCVPVRIKETAEELAKALVPHAKNPAFATVCNIAALS